MLKKMWIMALLLCVVVVAWTRVNRNREEIVGVKPKLLMGSGPRTVPPLGSASNLHPKSMHCGNEVEYTLATAKKADSDTICILDISGLGLTSLPAEVSNYKNLSVIVSNYGNNLETLSGIEELKYLTEVSIVGSSFNDLPDELWGLKDLLVLNCVHCGLTKINPKIGELVGLKQLNLNGNRLMDVDGGIAFLTKLEKLYLAGNKLTSTTRDRLGEMLPWVDLYFEEVPGL